MSLNIKNEQTERLAKELATATGESVTGAVTVAVRERLDRLREKEKGVVAHRAARIREIANDAGGRWIEPNRDVDHGDFLVRRCRVAHLIVDTSAIVAVLRGEPGAGLSTDVPPVLDSAD